jgi:hypothetical protein
MGMGFLFMAFGVIFTALNSNADVPQETPPSASETSVKPEEVTFELIKDLKFADGTEVKSVTKTDIDDLRDLPVWMGGNDHIDGLTLTHKQKELLRVRTCREYDSAMESGYYADTGFDVKMSVWFKFQCGLLNALETAEIPRKSFISDPKVGVINLELLRFTIFPYNLADSLDSLDWEEARDMKTTYQDMVAAGELRVETADQNVLGVEDEGMAQTMEEVVRADFNNDGIEDILVFEYHRAIGGTLGFGGIIMLTRKSIDGKLEEVRPPDPAQSFAHPYWFHRSRVK